MLDLTTVGMLRLKMLAHSSIDADAIRAGIECKELFPRVKEDTLRQGIKNRLLKCRRIITLKSFFEDTIYLEAYLRGLYKLILLRARGSIVTLRELLQRSFAHP